MSPFESVNQKLAAGRDLSAAEAEEVMHWLIGGEALEQDIVELLNAFCDKGVTTDELASFAFAMRQKAALLEHPFEDLVDTCGTGGGQPTFNISTAAAFVAAGAGVRIAKHGNRSTTGLGSADVLEFLGVRLGNDAEALIHQLETIGISFLFAPAHHPAMRHVASARKALGRRSVFNLLGPMSNPAGATRQVIGIYDPNSLKLVAETIGRLGTRRALVVHSEDGLDEISPCAASHGVLLCDGDQKEVSLQPEDFGVARLRLDQIAPGNLVNESAAILLEAIGEIESPRASAVIPSAAAAIWIAGLEPDFGSAGERARTSIRNGWASMKLAQLVESGSRS